MPHGFGLLIKNDLTRYFGRFKHGKMNGRFYKRDQLGKVFKQNYEKGSLQREVLELKHTNFFEILNTDTLDYTNFSCSLSELLTNSKSLGPGSRQITSLKNMKGRNQTNGASPGIMCETPFESYLNNLYTKIKTCKEIPSITSNKNGSPFHWKKSLGSRRQFLEDEKMGYIVNFEPQNSEANSDCSLGRDQHSETTSHGTTLVSNRAGAKAEKRGVSSLSEDGLKRSLKTRQFSFINKVKFVSDFSDADGISTEGRNQQGEDSPDTDLGGKLRGAIGKIRQKKMRKKLKEFSNKMEKKVVTDKQSHFREIFSGLFKAGVGKRLQSEGAEAGTDSEIDGEEDENEEGIRGRNRDWTPKSRNYKGDLI